MDVEQLVDLVAELATLDDCRAVRDAVERRAEAIRDAQHQAVVTARWAKLERCAPGTVLYVNSKGLFIGGALQRGDSLKVLRVDRQRERMEVKLHRIAGKLSRRTETFVISPKDAQRYELSRERPEAPVRPEERKMAADLAKVMR